MNILEVLFLCFILKKTIAVDVFIIDIPEKELNDGNESEYVYYDYEQSLAPNLVKNKPLPVNTIGLSRPKKKDQIGICDRFGSMYGISPAKHKCENLRGNKRQLITKPIFLKPVPYTKLKPIFLNQREKHKFNLNKDFSLDYVDDYWRTRPDTYRCTLKDIVTSRCDLRRYLSSQRMEESSDSGFSDSSEDDKPKFKPKNKPTFKDSSENDDDDEPKRIKPNRFKVVTKPNNKKSKHINKIEKLSIEEPSKSSESESVEFKDETIKKDVKSMKKKQIEPYKSYKESSETEEEKEIKQKDSSTETEEKVVKYKKPVTESEAEEELIEGDPLTEIEEEVKEDDTIESSFEENTPGTKYKYLQGHRFVNGKDFRRSRMLTFLPKRNTWKAEDIPKLSFFWFDGGPRGIS